MHPNGNLGYLFQHIAYTMSRQNDQILQQKIGIGYSQFKILMVLTKSPHIKQRQIAEMLGQTEASISRQIKLMVSSGLLQSNRSSENRREHLTTLTAKGERAIDEAIRILNSYHAPMFERLTTEQQNVLTEALQNMHACACSAGKTGACDRPFNA